MIKLFCSSPAHQGLAQDTHEKRCINTMLKWSHSYQHICIAAVSHQAEITWSNPCPEDYRLSKQRLKRFYAESMAL